MGYLLGFKCPRKGYQSQNYIYYVILTNMILSVIQPYVEEKSSIVWVATS